MTNIDTKTNNMATIQYSGKVTVSIFDGKSLISKHVYKNNGCDLLWKFLCYCLCNNYSEANLIRPWKIMLYYNDAIDPTTITINNLFDSEHVTAITSSIITCNVKPRITQDSSNIAATLHFLIPSSVVRVLDGEPKINQVVLFSANTITAAQDKVSAFYLFTKKVDNQIVWDTEHLINPNTLKDNYNLTIDWQMSFKNAE